MREIIHNFSINLSESKIWLLISTITVILSILSKYLFSYLEKKRYKKNITITIKNGDNVFSKDIDLKNADIEKIIEDIKASNEENSK